MVYMTKTANKIENQFERLGITDPKRQLKINIKTFFSSIVSEDVHKILLPAELNKQAKIKQYKRFYVENLGFLNEPEFDFDDEQSELFIKKTNEPNPNREKLKKLADDLLSDIDVFSEEIEWNLD